MANVKNGNRRKTKYGDQEPRTAKNKANKKKRHENRIARALMRAEELIGSKVQVRAQDGFHTGTVKDVIDKPSDAKRKGNYLKIETPAGILIRPRSRVKVIRDVSI